MTPNGASQFFPIKKSGRCQHLNRFVDLISNFTLKHISLSDFTFLSTFKTDAAQIMMNQNVSNLPIHIESFHSLISPYLKAIGVRKEITFANLFIILFKTLETRFMSVLIKHPDLILVDSLLERYKTRLWINS